MANAIREDRSSIIQNLGVLFFLVPFFLSVLNIQGLVGILFSESLSRLIAYLNYGLVLIGIPFFLGNSTGDRLPGLLKLWFIFYLLYYGIGLWASTIHSNEVAILRTTVAVVYFIGFSFFLRIERNRRLFERVAVVAYFISTLMLIYFSWINFSYDQDGIAQYALNRAGGVYGDANTAALMSLLTLILIFHVFKPKNSIQKVLKFLGLGITIYGLALTFSKTGFLVLLIILPLIFYKYINPRRVLILLFTVPFIFFIIIQWALESANLTNVQKSRVQDVVNIITLNTDKVSYSDRDILFENMLTYINENPVIGNGIYFSNEIRGHNTVFGVWADAGVFCFIFFLFMMFQFFRKSIMAMPRIRYYSLSILLVLFLFMLTLQTIINQSYLIVFFAYLGFYIDSENYQIRKESSVQNTAI